MPGFTHLQAAQPVTLGHHLLAYVEMFGRDRGRLADARARLNECPLGAAALAGTSFPIDRARDRRGARASTAPMANSIDAVSDRDFALEFLAAAAIAATHLSRLAEELVLWSTPQFGFVKMAEAFSSGSSIMPQKRNPDAAELVRGKAGRVIGDLQRAAGRAQGPAARLRQGPAGGQGAGVRCRRQSRPLPGGHGRYDQRHDRSIGTACAAAAAVGYTTATDLADWLVRAPGRAVPRGPPRRRQAVRRAEQRGRRLWPSSISRICRRSSRGSRAEVFEVLSVERSVASRTSFGGTAPARVRAAIQAARERYL